MKKRIDEIDQSNELAVLAISRTKNSIRRMRLEYSILLERLEENAVNFPDNLEDMSPPPSPSLDINDEKTLKGPVIKKQKRSKSDGTTGNSVSKSRIRDPNLPKRPTNAYLIFCELEKERIKQSTGDNSLASVTDLGKSLVEAWKNLDEEGRKPYHKIYEEEKERYRQEMLAYNKKNKGIKADMDGDDPEFDIEQDADDQDPEDIEDQEDGEQDAEETNHEQDHESNRGSEKTEQENGNEEIEKEPAEDALQITDEGNNDEREVVVDEQGEDTNEDNMAVDAQESVSAPPSESKTEVKTEDRNSVSKAFDADGANV